MIINFINFLSPKMKLLKNKNKIEERIKPTGLKHKVYKIIKNIMLNAYHNKNSVHYLSLFLTDLHLFQCLHLFLVLKIMK